ncbi:hypothetical protein MOK15_20165 [Sphingobium sp. BYY-5]|uniref:hypothetical protein n=1 Tax=Sphingobium sp. BYY-5 TaxID=2926400 RepID=UPI001FA6E49A|nr:hypothetical protein [Sphingobium sp. BYY-5]MCI4592387.1 hypothetical protein [Sphingobium sp. BYY-5]
MDDMSLISSYAEAQSLLARVEERRRLSPIRLPLGIRSRVAERHALARLDNLPLQDEDIRVDGRGAVRTSDFDLSHGRRAIGTPINLETITSDSAGLLDWLGIRPDRGILPMQVWQRPLADMIEAVTAWQRDIAVLSPSPPLLHSAHMAHLWRHHAPVGRGDLVYSLLIGDRWGPGRWDGSAGGLIALGLERSSAPWRRAQGKAMEQIWLSAIITGAQAHLDLEVRLRGYAARASQFINARRRPGRLKEVLALAMAHPRISSGSVAKSLDLSVAGAIKLLSIATDAGLLIERSGQASYRSYAIPVAAPSEAPSRTRADPFEVASFWSDEDDGDLAPIPI